MRMAAAQRERCIMYCKEQRVRREALVPILSWLSTLVTRPCSRTTEKCDHFATVLLPFFEMQILRYSAPIAYVVHVIKRSHFTGQPNASERFKQAQNPMTPKGRYNARRCSFSSGAAETKSLGRSNRFGNSARMRASFVCTECLMSRLR